MIRELISTFRKGMYERLSNPLIVSFVIAWFAWNWRGPALLFLSGAPVEDRIARIDEFRMSWQQLIAWPALAAAAYALLMPWVLHGVLWCRNAAYRRMKADRLVIETQLMELRKKLQEARTNYELVPERQRRTMDDGFSQNKHNRDRDLLNVREQHMTEMENRLRDEHFKLTTATRDLDLREGKLHAREVAADARDASLRERERKTP